MGTRCPKRTVRGLYAAERRVLGMFIRACTRAHSENRALYRRVTGSI